MVVRCGKEEARPQAQWGCRIHGHWPEAAGTLAPAQAPPRPSSPGSPLWALWDLSLLRGQQGRKDKDKPSCHGLSV